MGAEPSRRVRAYVEWTLRYGALLWAVALLLAAPATWRTATMYRNLKSDLEELLPRDAPSVRAIDEMRARLPGLQHLGVIVDVGDPANIPAGERLLDDLAAKIRTYPPELVRGVRTGNAEEQRFVERHAPLYLDLEDLRAIRERVEARRDYEVTAATGASLEDEGEPPPLDFSDIERKYADKLGGARFPTGRFSSPDKHLTMLLVDVGRFDSAWGTAGQLLERVRADVEALDPDRYAPGMRVGFAGDVAISVEELKALLADLSISSAVVAALVIAVIVTYFRWWWSVAVLLPPLLLATVLSFAVASLPPFHVRELNSNTAFLGSMVVGNGINFGIVLLARHLEERRRGRDVRSALALAVGGARAGTLSAALAASVAYGSLTLTAFRGFRQFGVIGGIGMILSWVVSFSLIPPLVFWLDRGRRVPRAVAPRVGFMNGLSRLVSRYYRLILVVTAVLATAALWKVRTFGADEIETDFSKLRRKDTWTQGEGYWGRKMDELLGTYLTPTVLLTDGVEHARRLAARLREEASRPPLDERISSIRALDDVVPTDQEEKIREAEAIREAMTPKLRSLIPADKRRVIDPLLNDQGLRPIGPEDLPKTFTTGLRERDGSLGRTVLVFPTPSRAWWQGPPLADFVHRLRLLAALSAEGGERPARVAGALPLSADILASVRKDGARASLFAFIGVIGVVLVLLRAHANSIVVVASLLLAIVWLLASTMALGVRINFANFIAYPITFGIGVDYAINVMTRYMQDGAKDIGGALRSTGGAVALCSLTTIIGYSSLLMAKNRALFLFGLVAVLGEILCLAAALVVVPAFLERRQHRRAARVAKATA